MGNLLTHLGERLRGFVDGQALADRLASGLGNLLASLLILFGFWLLWQVLRRVLKSGLTRGGADGTTQAFLQMLLKHLLIVVAAIAALDALGIRMSAVLASLGIAGLTIGFAAKDALSNLISGVLIYLDRFFVIGDLVEIEGRYGRVEKITLRSTRIVTVDGRMLAVPDSEIVNKTVASYTNFPHLMLSVPVAIGVGEDIDRARKLLLDLVTGDGDFLAAPPPRVAVRELGDYSVTLELAAWLGDERRHLEKRDELRERIFKAFTDAGVDMPYETIQLRPLEVRRTDSDSAA